jgi:hypothetical protein
MLTHANTHRFAYGMHCVLPKQAVCAIADLFILCILSFKSKRSMRSLTPPTSPSALVCHETPSPRRATWFGLGIGQCLEQNVEDLGRNQKPLGIPCRSDESFGTCCLEPWINAPPPRNQQLHDYPYSFLPKSRTPSPISNSANPPTRRSQNAR